MRVHRFGSLFVLACLLLAGCSSSAAIRTEASPAANFASYRTWSWVPDDATPPGERRAAGINDWRVRNAIEADLAARGWALTPAPDVFVDYGVVVEERSTDSFSGYAKYVAEGGRQSMGGAFVEGYQQGTLTIQMYDARTRQLVWRGSATAVLGDDDEVERVRAAIQQLLAKLPPG